MSSRTGSTLPGKAKPLTYGKASRKRQIDSIPLRTADYHARPSDRSASSSSSSSAVNDVAKQSKPRPPANPSSKPSPNNRPLLQTSRSLPGPSKERLPQSQDDANSRKRKRLDAVSSSTVGNRPVSTTSPSRSKTQISSPRPRVVSSAKIGSSSESPRRIAVPKETKKDVKAHDRPNNSTATTPPVRKLHPGSTTSNLKRPNAQAPSTSARRPRLIDALAAQRPRSPESDSSMEDQTPTQTSLVSGPATPSQGTPSLARDDSITRTRARPGVALQGKRVKYTYGQTRSILNDSQRTTDSGVASAEDDLDALLATPPELSQPDPFSFGDDDDVDDDGDVRPAIKSVHELRRAGANNRFADEMEDLLARIGEPGNATSMRRNALLELSQKLHRKDFITQFRDHATRDKVAVNIGQEEDTVTAFALTSILITFLKFNPAGHLIPQLAADGLGKMLDRLLPVSEDIVELASQKKMRLSGASKRSVNEVKTAMIRLDIWHGRRPEKLSPRMLALELLNILCQVDPGYSAGVVKDAKDALIAIMAGHVDDGTQNDAQFSLIISILESQSTLTLENGTEVSWILDETPKVAQFLSNALREWTDKPTSLQSKILKLAINTSNNEPGALGLNNGILLSRLSTQICLGFKHAQEAVNNKRLRAETFDGLLLILGVTINILEHCKPARENVDGESLEKLIALYLQNKAATSEADSVEKSQLSVAIGYLAVLVGYLSLVGSVRRRLADKTGGEGVQDLIGSIQEFVRIYKSVNNKAHELEGLVSELQSVRRMPG